MKTQIVYTLISHEEDIYADQALMSIWSCRRYNPTSTIIIVCDGETKQHLDSYPELNEYVSGYVVRDFSKEVSNFERSRFLKTRLRKLITGDYLYVDTDTIFTDGISEIDDIADELAIVEDIHAENLRTHTFGRGIKNSCKNIYSIDFEDSLVYYNSGVIYAKDTPVVHNFYELWYKNWLLGKDRFEGGYDQRSLLKTVKDMPDVVKSLNPNFNVQILGCIRYLHTGKILHFFNANWGRNSVHPFFDKSYYLQVKDAGGLTDKIKDDIINCKSLFSVPTFILGPEDIPVWLDCLNNRNKPSIWYRMARRGYRTIRSLFHI